jgi:hypothetical protein
MQIVVVWVVAFTLIAATTSAWYITQPLAIKTINQSQNYTQTEGINITGSDSTYLFLTYTVYWWGPVFDLVWIAWAIMSSVRRDVESEAYYD